MAEPWALELLLNDAALPAGADDVSGAFADGDEELLLPELPELPTWTADGGARGLRCLESSHGAECSRRATQPCAPAGVAADARSRRCTPPPSAAEETLWRLIGDAGKKNGEKKLRAQLAATAEWKSNASRAALAAQAAAEGEDETLVGALRRRDTSLLRKRHLFYLARQWCLRSDIWSARQRPPPRGRKPRLSGRAPRRSPTTTAAPAGGAVATTGGSSGSAPRPGWFTPASTLVLCAALNRDGVIRAFADVELRGLHVQSAQLLTGTAAQAVIASERAFELISPFALSEWRGVARVNEQLRGVCEAVLRAVREQSAAARAAELDMAAPAWRELQGRLSASEELMNKLRSVYSTALGLITTRMTARWAARAPGAAEALYFSEPRDSAVVSLDLISRCESALAQLRFASTAQYLTAAEAVAGAALAAVQAQGVAQTQRIAWLQDELAAADARTRVGELDEADFRVKAADFRVKELTAAQAAVVDWAATASVVGGWAGTGARTEADTQRTFAFPWSASEQQQRTECAVGQRKHVPKCNSAL